MISHMISHISRRFSFYFFKILIFWVVRGKKGQKIVQNEKKFRVQYLEKGDRKSYSDYMIIHRMIIMVLGIQL